MKIPKSKSRKNSAYTVFEVLIAFGIIGIFCTMVYSGILYQKTHLPNGYAAWVKMTGNPNNLTFEEWKSLTETQRMHNRNFSTY